MHTSAKFFMAGFAIVLAQICCGGSVAPKIDEGAKRVSVPAKVAKQNIYAELKGAIEYLIVSPGGKEYESLFICQADPLPLYEALVKAGMKPGSPARDEGDKYFMPKGAKVRVFIEYNDGKENKRVRAESFVLDSETQKSMQDVDWIFTGSKNAKDPESGKDMLQAVLVKNIIALYHTDATVLLQNPLKPGEGSSRYKAHLDILPKAGTDVTIVFEAAPTPAKREVPAGMKHIHLKVSGNVQGVGFREFAQRTAKQLKLSGWVRNLPGGEVELEAEGPEAAIKELEEKLAKGPRGAKVDKVAPVAAVSEDELGEFEIRETPAANQ